jgi:hypothetical protein
MQIHHLKRSILRRLRAMGYRTPKHGDPATRATVIDLSLHCTDKEIAVFTHSTPAKVRSHRRASRLNKYVSDLYIRPGKAAA